MKDGALSHALRRLEAAVASIEGVSGHVLDSREQDAEHEVEIALLAEDRTRLVEELDSINARAQRLESSNRDAARRLDAAIDTIRAVLAENGEG
jgi:hypothetical protein